MEARAGLRENPENNELERLTIPKPATDSCGVPGVMSNPKPGMVYFVRADRSRYCKIGWTGDLAARLPKLQTGNHLPLKLLAAMPGTRGDEAQLHHRFARDRASGEWFALSLELREFIDAIAGSRLAVTARWAGVEVSDDDVLAALIAVEARHPSVREPEFGRHTVTQASSRPDPSRSHATGAGRGDARLRAAGIYQEMGIDSGARLGAAR